MPTFPEYNWVTSLLFTNCLVNIEVADVFKPWLSCPSTLVTSVDCGYICIYWEDIVFEGEESSPPLWMYVYNVTHQHSLPYMDVVRSHLMMIILKITTKLMMRITNHDGRDDDYDLNRKVDHIYITYRLIMTSSALVRRRCLILQSYKGNYFNSSL